MLIPFLGKTEKEKRVIVNTIGPVWDGNEVWLLTAGGATFAAFPGWYATLFSGLYLPLFLVLVGLIIRGVAFEYRSKHPDAKWRNAFDWMASIGSFIVAAGVRRRLRQLHHRPAGGDRAPATRRCSCSTPSPTSGSCSARSACSAACAWWRCSCSTARSSSR